MLIKLHLKTSRHLKPTLRSWSGENLNNLLGKEAFNGEK